jgi:histone H3/H4
VREAADRPGAILEAISPKIHPRGDLPKAGEFRQAGRYLDASLICIDLLDNPGVERLARAMLKSIEGAAIMELAKVEISMADKKYKDAILRCREAARQFAWVPPGERLRKRLAELESRPEVQRALATDD